MSTTTGSDRERVVASTASRSPTDEGTVQMESDNATRAGVPAGLEGLEPFGTALLFDAIETLGHVPRVLDHPIAARAGTEELLGYAFTVSGRPDPRPRSEHLPSPWDGFQMFDAIGEGDVVVIASGGEAVAGVWGQIMTTAAVARGAIGVVIDGLTRDLQRLAQLDSWGVFCRGATPVEGDGRWQPVDYQVPITLPGRLENAVRVTPGDVVVGDHDGVLTFPRTLVPDVVACAASIASAERSMLAELSSGTRFADAYARHQAF